MIVFLKGLELILPIYEKPMTQWKDGREVTGAINEIMAELNKAEQNGWVWSAPAKPLRCYTKTLPAQGPIANEFSTVVPAECFKEPKTPGQLVDRLNHKQKSWREFVLRDAYAATSGWQDFVLQFTNTYSSAYKTYSYFVSQIANQRFLVEKGVAGAEPDYLYWRPEHWGLPVDYSKWNRKICNLPKETQDILAEGRAVIEAEMKRGPLNIAKQLFLPDTFLFMPTGNADFGLTSPIPFNVPTHYNEPKAFAERMKIIHDGLVAMDCRVPMSVLPEYKSIRGVTPEQLEKLRLGRFNKAISTLFSVLTREPGQGHARWTDAGRGIDHPMYPWFAKINPFMKLNMILADPEPYPEGVAFVRMLNDEPTYIDQDRKTEHPRKVGNIATPKMTEYLLANMVCGPDANRRDQVSILSMSGKARSIFSRPFSGAADTTATNERMVEIVRGWKSQFIPPRIVEDPGYDLCRTKPAAGDWKMDAGEIPTNDYQWDPHMNRWDIRGKRYWGLVGIVKGTIRRDVLGDSMNDGTFQKWWAANVEPSANAVVADFKNEFRKIVSEKYLPALGKQDRATYNGRSFALGARNSLFDEVNLNLAILQRLQKAGRTPSDSAYDGVKTNVDFIQRTFERGLKMVGTPAELKSALLEEAKGPIKIQGQLYYTDAKQPVTYSSPVAIAAYARTNEFLKNAIKTLDNVLKATSPKLAPAALKNVNSVREAAIMNLNSLVTELDSYNGMLLTLRLEDTLQAAN